MYAVQTAVAITAFLVIFSSGSMLLHIFGYAVLYEGTVAHATPIGSIMLPNMCPCVPRNRDIGDRFWVFFPSFTVWSAIKLPQVCLCNIPQIFKFVWTIIHCAIKNFNAMMSSISNNVVIVGIDSNINGLYPTGSPGDSFSGCMISTTHCPCASSRIFQINESLYPIICAVCNQKPTKGVKNYSFRTS